MLTNTLLLLLLLFLQISSDDDSSRKRRSLSVSGFGIEGTRVYLRLDIRKCEKGLGEEQKRCFHTIEEAAEYLQAIIESDQPWPDFPFPFVKAEPLVNGGGVDPGSGSGSGPKGGWEYYMVAILALLLVIAIVGVLVSVNRKRQRGTTWFPEGFIQTLKPKGKNASRNSGVSVRKGPDGEEMKHIHGSQVGEMFQS